MRCQSTHAARNAHPSLRTLDAQKTVPQVRDQLMDWLCEREMTVYTTIFSMSNEGGPASLERFERRYAWFAGRLEERREVWALFPPAWRVPQTLAMTFCKITKVRASGARLAGRSRSDAHMPRRTHADPLSRAAHPLAHMRSQSHPCLWLSREPHNACHAVCTRLHACAAAQPDCSRPCTPNPPTHALPGRRQAAAVRLRGLGGRGRGPAHQGGRGDQQV